MEAKSLMIGDWVMLDKTYPSTGNKPTRLTLQELIYIEQGKECEPIPLTEDILKKNGWKESQFWHEYQDGKNTIQSCLPDMRGRINGVEIQHFNCGCVHQYQHLLRLCGLNELADNFKVN